MMIIDNHHLQELAHLLVAALLHIQHRACSSSSNSSSSSSSGATLAALTRQTVPQHVQLSTQSPTRLVHHTYYCKLCTSNLW
jgi:hypothetical protein